MHNHGPGYYSPLAVLVACILIVILILILTGNL